MGYSCETLFHPDHKAFYITQQLLDTKKFMIPFYLTLIILPILAIWNYFLYSSKPKYLIHYSVNSIYNKHNRNLCIFCASICVILHTFINPHFSDLNPYCYRMFLASNNYSYEYIFDHNFPHTKAEVGFRLLCKLLVSISNDVHFFLLVTGILITIGYYDSIKRYSPFVLLSFLFFFCDMFIQSLSGLRQHIVMSIMLLTYPLIIKRKLWLFLLIFLICYTIHQSVIIFLPTFFFYGIRNEKKLITSLILYAIVLYVGLKFFIIFFVENFTSTEASYNLNSDVYGISKDGENGKIGLLFLGVLIFRIYVMKKEIFRPGINKLLTILLCLGALLPLVMMGLKGAGRLNMYFTSLSFLIVPNTLAYIKNNGYKLLCAMTYWSVLLFMLIKKITWATDNDMWFFTSNW